MNPQNNTTTSANPYSGFQDLSAGMGGSGAVQNPAFSMTTSGNGAPNPQQSTGNTDSGNWFTHLLPTIGGLVLPAIGAALAPETGGLSLLASAGLSGLGGVLGKGAENATEGKDLGNDVLTSGIENAVGGGVGGVLSKVGGALLPKVASIAGKGADSLIAGQAAKGQIPTDLANTLRTQYGTTNLQNIGDASQYITGKDIGIDKGINSIMNKAGDNGLSLDMSSYGRSGTNLPGDAVNNAAVANGLGQGTKQANAVQDYMDRLLQKYNPDAITSVPGAKGVQVKGFDNGVLNSQTPINVKQMTSEIGNQASNWMNSRDPLIQAQGKALNQLRGELTDNLYGPASGGAVPVTQADKDLIANELAPVEKVDSGLYKALVDKVYSSNTVGDLRSIQAPIVQTNNALQTSAKIASSTGGNKLTDMLPMGGGTTGFALGGVPGGLAGYTAGKALESEPAQRLGASVLSNLSGALGSKNAGKTVDLLARTGAIGAANLPNMGSGPVGGGNQPVLGMGNGNTETGSMQPGNQQFSNNGLVNAMATQAVLAPTLAGQSGASSFLSAIEPMMQKEQVLNTALNGLQGSFNNAGGAQGMGGLTSILASLIPGTAANAFQQQKASTAALLGSVLGTNTQEAQNFLPGLLQPEQVANQRMANLNNILASLPVR